MPYDELVVHTGHLGGAVFAYPPTRRCYIVVDEDATEDDVLKTIRWAREVLRTGQVIPALDFFDLRW